jgi:hypothetical protein
VEGKRRGRTEQNLSPLPQTEPHRGSGKTSLKEVEIKTNEKNSSLRREKRTFRGFGMSNRRSPFLWRSLDEILLYV